MISLTIIFMVMMITMVLMIDDCCGANVGSGSGNLTTWVGASGLQNPGFLIV